MQNLKTMPKADVEGGGPGTIEAMASATKGQRLLKRMRLDTPVTALAYSVSGVVWWERWLSARLALNLVCSPCMLDTNHNGHLTNKPMKSQSATQWLKGVLASLGVPEGAGKPIGSHSCKATFQSWLSRWGMAPSARRALGHRIKPGDQMPMVHSRDFVIGPLGGVVMMVQAIRSLTWDPDSVKSVLLKAALKFKDEGGASEPPQHHFRTEPSGSASSKGLDEGQAPKTPETGSRTEDGQSTDDANSSCETGSASSCCSDEGDDPALEDDLPGE